MDKTFAKPEVSVQIPTLDQIIAKKVAVHLRQGRTMGASGMLAYKEFSEEVYRLLLNVNDPNVTALFERFKSS